MNFKHGQRVKCTIDGTEINDAKISINNDGIPFICQNQRNGIRANNMLGYKYSWVLDSWFKHPDVTNLRPAEGFYPAVGDVIVNEYGKEAEVLEVLTQSFLKSCWNNPQVAGAWFTFKEAEVYGWKIKGQPEPEPELVEITIEEIARLKGIKPEQVRVKKDGK